MANLEKKYPLLIEFGINFKTICEVVGVSKNTVYDWLKGVDRPIHQLLTYKMAEHLGTSAEELREKYGVK